MSHTLGIAIGFIAVPGFAQDMPGAISLPDLARTQVQSGTARGYADRGYARNGGDLLDPETRRICAAAPRLARQHGSNHPKVRGLYSA